MNSIRWDAAGECATLARNPEPEPKLWKQRPSPTMAATANEPALKNESDKEKPGRVHHMVGDRMAGSDDAISSELPNRTGPVFMLLGAEEPDGGSQSVRSSEEAGNDRGAKGRRKVKT